MRRHTQYEHFHWGGLRKAYSTLPLSLLELRSQSQKLKGPDILNLGSSVTADSKFVFALSCFVEKRS